MQTEKKEVINRLKRIEGQLRGVQKMIQEDQECIDIVTQLTAIRSSINSTLGVVISNRISQVIHHPEEDSKDQEERIQEALKMIIKK
ncbi:metal-sensing transcriptional repressor [Streptococcus hyovaginalis]|uniref:metal-sensing transcriptional repressor n=1 Tax=Streptococcus hyovaginalis TaxID=149015 RepID=UPI0014780743|nr:metal-sensing transcriptional repressor [Streptococcus hyovaginalis]MDY3024194.1 metal-sensing transcriptional repressor [Streptococcus hyovaginalis]MDY4510404.1 metal-sensing transcriptional repressor [Streptococcus hyovaginalis]MDY5974550.1 metal-sensing transcriptional repressor [Streptococcus hyovaginalis]